jgi:hypothetical protein
VQRASGASVALGGARTAQRAAGVARGELLRRRAQHAQRALRERREPRACEEVPPAASGPGPGPELGQQRALRVGARRRGRQRRHKPDAVCGVVCYHETILLAAAPASLRHARRGAQLGRVGRA